MTQPVVFVSNANALRHVPGGQQLCTREYLETVQAASFDPTIVDFTFRRDLSSRVRRKIRPNPYRNALPSDLVERIADSVHKSKANWVFFNLTELTPLASPLKRLQPKVKIAVLSHGAESVDYFHSLRIKSFAADGGPASIRERVSLADQLLDEASSRPFIDHMFVLAPFEAEYERWLGSPQVTWVPRQVPRKPLDWRPISGRIGFVATLDHWPTIEALDLYLPELAKRVGDRVRLRLVGGPAAEGEALKAKYPFIDFVGFLDEAELRNEASTWTCFPQPLFCWSRGCNTKLATALSWSIPVVATPQGIRGYTWKSGELVMVKTPAEAAEQTIRLAVDESFRNSAKASVEQVAASVPTLPEVASIMRKALEQS